MELMDYRYENPEVDVSVDSKITEKFISRDRNLNSIENFELWASLSKEKNNLEKMINAYKTVKEENVINITK
jgi:hypothetical protein